MGKGAFIALLGTVTLEVQRLWGSHTRDQHGADAYAGADADTWPSQWAQQSTDMHACQAGHAQTPRPVLDSGVAAMQSLP